MILVALLLITACGSLKTNIQNNLFFSKGPCKGFCTEYEIQIRTDNTLSFKITSANANQEEKVITLSIDDVNKINTITSKIDWNSNATTYDENIYDLPLTTLKYNTRTYKYKRSKSVPNEVQELEILITQFLTKYELLKLKTNEN